ncbi:MAG: substrate-binding domain-containing protein [Chloroflexi bacterium]|nr:substrate-binding domain-containing protein [Chloroflexota bacterium]MCI0574734.1 substrate-binding domain-containing protein [Chloroflexota bacterium]MCI0646295.1 substrate-binding domain-containing protein [Chloroflexota bacterium]MCI0730307.1 substrate-binding domain-containing protein [Chloroflexota bacterium]
MNRRRTLLSLLSLLLVLVLVACGGAQEATEEPTQAPAETEAAPEETAEEPTEEAVEEPTEEAMEEPTEEAMEEPTEEPAAELGDPLKIGVMSDLSGGLALFGNEMWNGLQLGFEYATDGTMVAGNRPIELIILDDTSDVEAGAAAARELIESEGVEILIGNTSSAVALQVQQIADENEIVYFAAPAAAPGITGENWNQHTFRVCRNAAQDGLTMAGWSLENVGSNYLILAEDYAFGQQTAAGFQAAFSALGATFLTEEPIYAPSDTTDFTPYIQEVLEAEPDGLILIWATNTSGTILFEQLSSQGVTGNIPFITGFSSNDTIPLLDPGNVGATGLIVYHYSLPQTEANDWLVEQHNEQFGGNPDLFSECGFATAQAVAAALEATGGDTDPAALIAALEGLEFEGPKGTYVIRPEDHQALASMYIVRLVSVDDPDERYFELVEEISGEQSAPPCTAPNCG